MDFQYNSDKIPTVFTIVTFEPMPSISFNDTDNVLKFKDKDLPGEINNIEPEKISAPKTIERLEKISTDRHEQRKFDELEDDDDDDGDAFVLPV